MMDVTLNESESLCMWEKDRRYNVLCADVWRFGCVTVFFRTHKTLESVDPQFTVRRKMEQLREELELMEQLREVWRHTHTEAKYVN